MLSEKATNISPAATIEISARIAELRRQGTNIISLNIGEPDYPTPENISQAAKSAIDAHFTKYQPVPGILELREAICKKFKTDNGLTYQPNEICVSAGAKQAVFNAVFVLCGEGDEVIIPTPCWVSYSEIVKLVGATPVYVPCAPEENFDLNLTGIRSAISSRTKAILINTPNNPTGAVYSEQTLRALGELAVEHGFIIISDEIYAELTYGQTHCSIATLPGMWERTIVVNGFSKAYAMTGWRLGYSCAPAPIIKQMLKLHQYGIMCASTASQFAGVEAVNHGDADIEYMKEQYNFRRTYVTNRLEKMNIPCFEPEGAFYVFPCISGYGMKSETFCERLMNERGVAIVPGSAFGAGSEGFARISYAYSIDHLEEALNRMEAFLADITG